MAQTTKLSHNITEWPLSSGIKLKVVDLVLNKTKRRKETVLTIKTAREQMKNRTYPKRFRFLVLIFASQYASIEIVPSANG